jgi:hypothetical protein
VLSGVLGERRQNEPERQKEEGKDMAVRVSLHESLPIVSWERVLVAFRIAVQSIAGGAAASLSDEPALT